jgi:hypothetical protein
MCYCMRAVRDAISGEMVAEQAMGIDKLLYKQTDSVIRLPRQCGSLDVSQTSASAACYKDSFI